MIFYVARDGKVLGEFDEERFQSELKAGRIGPADHYFIEGFADWRPVYEYNHPPPIPKITPKRTVKTGTVIISVGVVAIGVLLGIAGNKSNEEPVAREKEAEAKQEEINKSLIAERKVRIGMTADQCVQAWGLPQEGVNTTITRNVRHEQWCYGDGRYLYFDNGVLVSIQK